ncbi:MAG: hypothetical protein ACYSX1_05515 [Planctomycetota bacterium]
MENIKYGEEHFIPGDVVWGIIEQKGEGDSLVFGAITRCRVIARYPSRVVPMCVPF